MGNTYHHHSEERKPLRWFASPLKEDQDGKEKRSPPITRENTQSILGDGVQIADTEAGLPLELERDAQELRGLPAFQRHAEATNVELFFDLCKYRYLHPTSNTSLTSSLLVFVANLTTFTSLKEINDSASLRAYIGFFSLLWLTWYSNSLYDVRFTADCIFERCAKALHFGVMVGFAVVGPTWEPGKATSSLQKYQILSFILMFSRLVLAAQYGVTLYFVRKHKSTILPLSLVIGSTLVASIIFGAITGALPVSSSYANCM
jgi:hypothetical protein